MDLEITDKIKTPEVSVIVPTFNRKDLLKEALDSIKEQTFKDWECIIVDDGSADGTLDLVKEYERQDCRFRYFRRPSHFIKGAASCRNFGLAKSRGRYIQWLDDDDLISEDKFELQVTSLKKLADEYYFTTCAWDLFWPGKKLDLKIFFPEDKVIPPKEFFKILRQNQTFLPASTYLIPYKLSVNAGPWNTLLTLNDDAEYFTRVLLQAKGLHFTSGGYALYREHSGIRLSRKNDMEGLESFFLSLRLMHAHLLKQQIKAKSFFRWKLKKILLDYSKDHERVFKFHRFFFLEHGINLNKIHYYKIRFFLYKKLFPVYKKIINS